ncbi:MAG: MerR family transcriptional regulator [Actinomycetota bacterium]
MPQQREDVLTVQVPSQASVEPTLTVAAVARRLGVAPATLRTWARRYGLGPSEHTAGAHRRYNPEDLTRLLVMRRLTHEGVPPAQAAEMALADDALSPVSAAATLLGDERLGDLGRSSLNADSFTVGSARSRLRFAPAPVNAPVVRGLTRAAAALDAHGVSEVLRRSIRLDGVIVMWDSLAVPVLQTLGEQFRSTGKGIETEHIFSEALMGVLRATSDQLTAPRNSVPVLLACPGDDQHSLPMHAIAAALAERGVMARQLGMRVPLQALQAAVRRIGPGVVMLYATLPVSSADQLMVLSRSRPTPRILLGGPGWPARVPPAMTRVLTIGHAVEDIVNTVL